jgi:orotate phosphoribosyltransferase
MRKVLKDYLKGCGALRYGSFTLASGAESSYYIDIKRASTDPVVLREMARELAGKMMDEEIECDRLAGVVLGSIPLAVALSLETGIPYVMVRKERKEHGTGSDVEGLLEQGDRVMVVEDVVTSAGSAADAVRMLRDHGAVVNDVMAVVDRESGGRELLESMDLQFYALLDANDLLED